VALATVLLAPSPAFDRFDEILYLVEKASDLTLSNSSHGDVRRRTPFSQAIAGVHISLYRPGTDNSMPSVRPVFTASSMTTDPARFTTNHSMIIRLGTQHSHEIA
jgi:hypothetical protein